MNRRIHQGLPTLGQLAITCHQKDGQTQTYPTKTKLSMSLSVLLLLSWILKLSGAIPIWKGTNISNDRIIQFSNELDTLYLGGKNPWIGR